MDEMPGQDELNHLACELRESLELPQDWVQVFADEETGHHVGVALSMAVEDVGGPESGPRPSTYPERWISVFRRNKLWTIELYSMPDEGGYDFPMKPTATRSYSSEYTITDVVERVVSLIKTHPGYKLDKELKPV